MVQNTLLSSILFDTAGMRVEKQDHKDVDAAGTFFLPPHIGLLIYLCGDHLGHYIHFEERKRRLMGLT